MSSQKTFHSNLFTQLLRHRELIGVLVKNDFLGRYRGSYIGLLWSFLTPIFMLAIFTFVFSTVFQTRWPNTSGSNVEFALLLFLGLLIFNFFSESLIRTPTLITSHVNYVKKVRFPLEVLPFVYLLTALCHMLISFAAWLTAYTVMHGAPHFTVLFLPFVLMPFCLLMLGFNWILASLGVFLRDINQLMQLVTTSVLFLSPIFYPVDAFPEKYRLLLYLNPLTIVVEQTRSVMYWGTLPDLRLLALYWLITLVICYSGFTFFQVMRKGFADVL